MPADRNWEDIERNNAAPMISVDWGVDLEDQLRGEGDEFGRVDWFRAIPDAVRRRRSKHPVGSEFFNACEAVLMWWKYYHGQARNPEMFRDRVHWSHTILGDMANWMERRTGKIDALAQAILRDAMHSTHSKERLGR